MSRDYLFAAYVGEHPTPQIVVVDTPYDARPLDCLGESGEFVTEMHCSYVDAEPEQWAIRVVPLRTAERDVGAHDVWGVSVALLEAVPVGDERILTAADFPLTVVRGMRPPPADRLAQPEPEEP